MNGLVRKSIHLRNHITTQHAMLETRMQPSLQRVSISGHIQHEDICITTRKYMALVKQMFE